MTIREVIRFVMTQGDETYILGKPPGVISSFLNVFHVQMKRIVDFDFLPLFYIIFNKDKDIVKPQKCWYKEYAGRESTTHSPSIGISSIDTPLGKFGLLTEKSLIIILHRKYDTYINGIFLIFDWREI